MRILIDGRLYGLENAGLGRYIINLVREISQLDNKNKYVLLLRKKYFNSLRLPPNWEKVLADYRHYSFAEQFKLPGLISSHRPDLVHFPHFNIPVFYKGDFVITIHDILMHKQRGLSATTLPALAYFIKRLGYRLVFDKAVNKAKSVIVPSVSVKRDLISLYSIPPKNVFVTHEGVEDVKVVGSSVKLNKSYFIYAGNAYPHKNLSRLVEAIKSLNTNYTRRVGLAIVSSRNVFIERLKKLIYKIKADGLVSLLGYVPDADLTFLYKNSVGFVYPSLSEGFGLPGIEAMRAGTLVLASDIPVFKEIYGQHAIYFNPLDFSSIQKAMQTVLEMDKSNRAKRIIEAKKFSMKYSWTKMAKETLLVYENSIGLRQN